MSEKTLIKLNDYKFKSYDNLKRYSFFHGETKEDIEKYWGDYCELYQDPFPEISPYNLGIFRTKIYAKKEYFITCNNAPKPRSIKIKRKNGDRLWEFYRKKRIKKTCCKKIQQQIGIKASQFVGVMPLYKLDNLEKQSEDNVAVMVLPRFEIEPVKMLAKVLEGADYWENRKMLRVVNYNLNDWKRIASLSQWKKKDSKNDKIIIGLLNGVGYVDLSMGSEGQGENRTSNDYGVLPETIGAFEVIDFVGKAKEICKKNLKKQSQRVEENLNCKIKGRILIQKQLKYNEFRGQPQKIYCAYNKMSSDIVENQIIKYALYLCKKQSIGDALAEDIGFCMGTLRGVPLKKCGTSDFVGLKNNGAYKQYKDALLAAKKIISRYSVASQSSGDNGGKETQINHKVTPFFLNMNLLFEYYARALFREAIDELNRDKLNRDKETMQFSGEFVLEGAIIEDNDKKRLLNKNDEVSNYFMKTYIPDITIRYKDQKDEKDDGRVIAVIDAKCSDVRENKDAKRSRTHQVLFYMKAMNCKYGGLISPQYDQNSKTKKNLYGDLLIDGKESSINTLCYIPLFEGKDNDGKDLCVKNIKKLLIRIIRDEYRNELITIINKRSNNEGIIKSKVLYDILGLSAEDTKVLVDERKHKLDIKLTEKFIQQEGFPHNKEEKEDIDKITIEGLLNKFVEGGE